MAEDARRDELGQGFECGVQILEMYLGLVNGQSTTINVPVIAYTVTTKGRNKTAMMIPTIRPHLIAR
jgi:hypothetical protein